MKRYGVAKLSGLRIGHFANQQPLLTGDTFGSDKIILRDRLGGVVSTPKQV
jgi:hypothetical protein